LAIDHLHKVAPAPVDRIALPPQSAFGAVNIDVAGCTLCLACVGACPTGAMQDNPDSPQLRFQEGACIQCGLCRVTCPENVITLEPRLDFTEASRMALVMKEEEPYECVRCGQPFGTRGTIEKIVEQLANKHSMFQNEETIERIKMCADCRVTSQFESNDNPFAGKDRPIPRTTDDYLRERAEIEEARARFKAGKPIIDDSGES
jgi:ferredoxin